jgi:hypothetical protein
MKEQHYPFQTSQADKRLIYPLLLHITRGAWHAVGVRSANTIFNGKVVKEMAACEAMIKVKKIKKK